MQNVKNYPKCGTGRFPAPKQQKNYAHLFTLFFTLGLFLVGFIGAMNADLLGMFVMVLGAMLFLVVNILANQKSVNHK